jgi:hypothetical protein
VVGGGRRRGRNVGASCNNINGSHFADNSSRYREFQPWSDWIFSPSAFQQKPRALLQSAPLVQTRATAIL